jgi:hypothetical protein
MSCQTVCAVIKVWDHIENGPFRAAGHTWTQHHTIHGNRAYTTLHSPGIRYVCMTSFPYG